MVNPHPVPLAKVAQPVVVRVSRVHLVEVDAERAFNENALPLSTTRYDSASIVVTGCHSSPLVEADLFTTQSLLLSPVIIHHHSLTDCVFSHVINVAVE